MTATLRYFAAAKAAAGTGSDAVEAATLAEALDVVRRRHDDRFARVLGVCALLVDGEPVGARDHAAVALRPGAEVDVLPPFAGG